MTKLYAYLLAGAVALAAVAGLYAWGQQGRSQAQEARQNLAVVQSQLETASESLRLVKRAAALDREVVQKRADVAVAQRKAAERRAKDLSNALQAAPDWADRPIPDGVYNALTPAAPGDQAPPPGGAAAGLPGPLTDRTHKPVPR